MHGQRIIKKASEYLPSDFSPCVRARAPFEFPPGKYLGEDTPGVKSDETIKHWGKNRTLDATLCQKKKKRKNRKKFCKYVSEKNRFGMWWVLVFEVKASGTEAFTVSNMEFRRKVEIYSFFLEILNLKGWEM